MKAYARFHEVLNVGYSLNGLSILDVKFANLVPLWPYLYRQDDWRPPFLSWIFKDVPMIAYAMFYGFLTEGYF